MHWKHSILVMAESVFIPAVISHVPRISTMRLKDLILSGSRLLSNIRSHLIVVTIGHTMIILSMDFLFGRLAQLYQTTLHLKLWFLVILILTIKTG